MSRYSVAACIAALLVTACAERENTSGEQTPASSPGTAPTAATLDEARRIAHEHIIVDGHIDVPFRLEANPADVAQATEGGDFDYPRAVAGGLNAPFMSIYTSTDVADRSEAYALANKLIDGVEALVAANPDKFAIALRPADVRSHFAAGLMSLPLGMENGSPIDGDLGNVAHFYERGIRYITLAHGKSNRLSDSSYDDNRQWDGLSDFGVAVVREMNRLGIMVDVSHLSDAAFYDVIELSAVPVIASHSSARHFTPGFERNMSDEMIRALAGNGGVIMINFGSSFITEEANRYVVARGEAEKAYKAENPDVTEDFLDEEFPKIYASEHGSFPYASLEDVLLHFEHVIKLVGVDYVGIGSDYDGVGDSLPTGLKDVSSYPGLVQGLLSRGYSEADISKILGENLLRVWGVVAEYAAGTGGAREGST